MQASSTFTADHYSADRDLERAASTAASASHVSNQAARANAQTPTRGRSARAAPGTNARLVTLFADFDLLGLGTDMTCNIGLSVLFGAARCPPREAI